MKIRRKHIRSIIERLLTSHDIPSAPVRVEDLAKTLGADVRYTPAKESLSGFLLRDHGSGRALIGVNNTHHDNRQRFTIAHEIGHFLLHTGQDVYVQGCSGSGLKVSLRDENASARTDVEEREANFFAAELLMPAMFLHADLKSYGTFDFLEEDTLGGVLGSLAEKYKVSKHALAYRLVNLGYVQP
jgi:Zn-dependent peptidase ImmA (M78 family)